MTETSQPATGEAVLADIVALQREFDRRVTALLQQLDGILNDLNAASATPTTPPIEE